MISWRSERATAPLAALALSSRRGGGDPFGCGLSIDTRPTCVCSACRVNPTAQRGHAPGGMYLLRTLRSPCTSRPPIPPIPRQQRGGGPHAHHAHPERARHLPSWRRGTAELCLLLLNLAEKMELAAAPVVLPAGQWGLRRRAVVETKRLPVASTARPAAARDARSNGSQPLPEQTQQELEARAVAERAEAVAMAAGLNEGRDDDDDPGWRHRPRNPSGTFPGMAGARLGLVFLAVQAVMFVVNMCAPCAPLSTASFLSYAWRCAPCPTRTRPRAGSYDGAASPHARELYIADGQWNTFRGNVGPTSRRGRPCADAGNALNGGGRIRRDLTSLDGCVGFQLSTFDGCPGRAVRRPGTHIAACSGTYPVDASWRRCMCTGATKRVRPLCSRECGSRRACDGSSA